MYRKIVNPKTGRLVNITSKLGINVLNNYLLQIGGNKKVFKKKMKNQRKKQVNYLKKQQYFH